MICMHCGYCCFNYEVIIVDDPDIGLIENSTNNLKEKHTGIRCPHLTGNICGEYSCAIHDRPWYEETPCYQHGQWERSVDTPCRLGVYNLGRRDMLCENPNHLPLEPPPRPRAGGPTKETKR